MCTCSDMTLCAPSSSNFVLIPCVSFIFYSLPLSLRLLSLSSHPFINCVSSFSCLKRFIDDDFDYRRCAKQRSIDDNNQETWFEASDITVTSCDKNPPLPLLLLLSSLLSTFVSQPNDKLKYDFCWCPNISFSALSPNEPTKTCTYSPVCSFLG